MSLDSLPATVVTWFCLPQVMHTNLQTPKGTRVLAHVHNHNLGTLLPKGVLIRKRSLGFHDEPNRAKGDHLSLVSARHRCHVLLLEVTRVFLIPSIRIQAAFRWWLSLMDKVETVRCARSHHQASLSLCPCFSFHLANSNNQESNQT